MNLFSKKDTNTARQFEFDFAKAVCIFGMVFVHCFEELPLTDIGYTSSVYYIVENVLDSLFGAGTFMICLGIGLTYTKNNSPNAFIKRGITTFCIGYLLNFISFVLPCCSYFFEGNPIQTARYLLGCFLNGDIMQFAGLTFLLFGLLKKLRIPDWGIAVSAVAMSIAGSFIRFLDFDSVFINEIVGLFFGTLNDSYVAPFPLFNWFIIVIFGYFLGKCIRKCINTEKFYAISTPVSAAIVIIYMIIAIPNRLGMMCGETSYYYQMTTFDALIIMLCAVLAFGVYHFVSKLFNEKTKSLITKMSININKTYCIQWVIIGWLSVILEYILEDGLSTVIIMLIALVIYIIASLLAELFRIKLEKKGVYGNVK